MALDPTALASDIASAMGYPTVSPQLIGWASGVLEEVKNGMATSRNTPSGHTISGISGSAMATLIADYGGYGSVSTQLTNYCGAIASNIMSNAIVTYTAPVLNPPAIQPPDAWYLNGTLSGLDGSSLASDVAAAVGYPSVSAKLLAKCTAITTHIMGNAEITDGVIV